MFGERRPPAVLARIVTCAWIQHIPPESGAYAHTLTPDGSVDITYRLDDDGRPTLSGPRTRPTREVVAAGTTTIGIRFRPGASARVLGVPASELVDETVDLRDVWNDSVGELSDALAFAGSAEGVVSVLLGAVSQRAQRAPDPDPVAQLIVRSLRDDTRRLRDIARFVGLSERQVRRRCVEAIGYGPKTLQRIARLQRLLAAASADTDWCLADLAQEYGYADQAHLTSEFRRLAACSPGQFIARMRAACGSHDHRFSAGVWRTLGGRPPT
jgi:AraC-like DNA-binding protein